MSLPTLLYNADILPMDGLVSSRHRRDITALIYQNGLIQYVGTGVGALQWLVASNQEHEAVDCAGACILPGFIDGHLHPMLMAIYQHNVDLNGVIGLPAVASLIQMQAAKTPSNEWVLALQLEEQNLETRLLPNRSVLDEICPDHALVIFKRDGHSIAVNTKALMIAGLLDSDDASEAIKEIQGGTVETDDNGQPSGVFKENAVQLVMSHFVGPSAQDLILSSQAVFKKLSAQGITSIGAILQTDHVGPSGAGGQYEFDMMNMLAADLPFSVYSILVGAEAKKTKELNKLPLNKNGHKIGAFKIFSDGTLGSCTACMFQGFFDQPAKRGYLTLSEDALYQQMLVAHLEGWQICIHAIGDKAVATCVKLYQKLLEAHPKLDHRHRIEHASVIDAETLQGIAKLKLVLCCQPLFVRSEQAWLAERLGDERCKQTYPFRAIKEAGIVMAGSSDAPIEDISVLAAIEVAVTRDGFQPEQSMSVDQALASYTCDAAYAQFQEEQKGSIEVGKQADLVLLDQNPHSVKPSEISKIKVLRTIHAGKQRYKFEGANRD